MILPKPKVFPLEDYFLALKAKIKYNTKMTWKIQTFVIETKTKLNQLKLNMFIEYQ